LAPASAPCPGAATDGPADSPTALRGRADRDAARLRSRRVPFDDIPRPAWDRLFSRTPCATPFSGWEFHRAWWDAYGPTAHDEYLVFFGASGGEDPAAGEIVAIAPLMHRHAIEADDLTSATILRQTPHEPATALRPTAKVVFFGASYHADYATLLCDPADLADVAAGLVACLARVPDEGDPVTPWDAVDLRRLRHDDPALAALEDAFRAAAPAQRWRVTREQEDVCPILRIPDGGWEDLVQSLDRKDRHELRRKMRRVESAGDVRFELVDDPVPFVDEFIAIHQAKWEDRGLFPDTPGGARSSRFLHRLAELHGRDGELRFGRLLVDGEMIFASLGFHSGTRVYFYNAGSRPEVRELSPGVVGVAWYLRALIDAGCRTFDFLRGDEPYKYTWGSIDEPLVRLLVTRA